MKKFFLAALFAIGSIIIFSCKKNNAVPDGCTDCNGDSDVTVTVLDPVAVTKTNSQHVYVAYQPWFEDKSTSPDGKWGSHWTMNNENPDIILSNGNRQIASWFYP